MKRIFSLTLLAIFLLSLVSFANAEEESGDKIEKVKQEIHENEKDIQKVKGYIKNHEDGWNTDTVGSSSGGGGGMSFSSFARYTLGIREEFYDRVEGFLTRVLYNAWIVPLCNDNPTLNCNNVLTPEEIQEQLDPKPIRPSYPTPVDKEKECELNPNFIYQSENQVCRKMTDKEIEESKDIEED